MAELRKTTVEYKCENEIEMEDLIKKAKKDATGIITQKTAYKTKRVKGEIEDSWWIVSITEDHTKQD